MGISVDFLIDGQHKMTQTDKDCFMRNLFHIFSPNRWQATTTSTQRVARFGVSISPKHCVHGNRKVVADSQPYKWLSLSQSLWRAYHHKRYITAVEELCREVWFKRESGFPSLFPPSLCQEFLGEVQRHRIACRPHGT